MCVTGVGDVIELVGAMGADLAPQLDVPSDPRDDLDETSRRVLEAVPVRRAAGPGEHRRDRRHRAGSRSCAALGGLAARGFVERVDAGWRLTARAVS